MSERTDRQRCVEGQWDGYRNKQTDGWIDKQTDRIMSGRTGRQSDEWKDSGMNTGTYKEK